MKPHVGSGSPDLARITYKDKGVEQRRKEVQKPELWYSSSRLPADCPFGPKPEETVRPLVQKLMRDQDAAVRAYTLLALEFWGKSADFLRSDIILLLDDPDANIQSQAKGLLRVFDGE